MSYQLRISGPDADQVARFVTAHEEFANEGASIGFQYMGPQHLEAGHAHPSAGRSQDIYRGAPDLQTVAAVVSIVAGGVTLYRDPLGLEARKQARAAWQWLIDVARDTRKKHPDAAIVLEMEGTAAIVLDQADANELVNLTEKVARFRRP